jgi:hypothetical protein
VVGSPFNFPHFSPGVDSLLAGRAFCAKISGNAFAAFPFFLWIGMMVKRAMREKELACILNRKDARAMAEGKTKRKSGTVWSRAGERWGRATLDLDQRAGEASAGAIKEEAEAEGFGTLDSDEAQLTADVVAVEQGSCLSLVGGGIALEPRDAFLKGMAETRADLEAFSGGLLSEHGGLQAAETDG